MQIKYCSHCSLYKSFDEFYKNKNAKFGLAAYCKEYYREKSKTPEFKAQMKRAKSKQSYKDRVKAWRLENKGRLREYRREWERDQWDNNPQYKLTKLLRGRLQKAIRHKSKSGSAVRDLGCSIEEFMAYMAEKFEPGMTWENHGEWEIDHIKPLSAFSLEDEKELRKACHYTNLQPLWQEDNRSKWAKFE